MDLRRNRQLMSFSKQENTGRETRSARAGRAQNKTQRFFCISNTLGLKKATLSERVETKERPYSIMQTSNDSSFDTNEAMSKLTLLEYRLAEVERSNKEKSKVNSVVDNTALMAYQRSMLTRLKAIRSALGNEGGGDVGAITRERDALLEENKKLKADNDKLNYRVMHLVRSMKE